MVTKHLAEDISRPVFLQNRPHSSMTYRKDNTWDRVRVDMEFVFECSTWYLKSERSELTREKRLLHISTGSHVLFCISDKNTDDDFFEDFPNISEHFLKII